MTHDELVAKINHFRIVPFDPLLESLRAVVELHKPSYGECEYCHTGQYHGGVLELEPYPCKTIQAIEKELG